MDFFSGTKIFFIDLLDCMLAQYLKTSTSQDKFFTDVYAKYHWIPLVTLRQNMGRGTHIKKVTNILNGTKWLPGSKFQEK